MKTAGSNIDLLCYIETFDENLFIRKIYLKCKYLRHALNKYLHLPSYSYIHKYSTIIPTILLFVTVWTLFLTLHSNTCINIKSENKGKYINSLQPKSRFTFVLVQQSEQQMYAYIHRFLVKNSIQKNTTLQRFIAQNKTS